MPALILYRRLAKRLFLFGVAAIVCLVPLVKYRNRNQQQPDAYAIMERQEAAASSNGHLTSNVVPIDPQAVNIVYVACGEQQIDDMFVSIKSILLLTNSPEITFIVFTNLHSSLEQIRHRFTELVTSKALARLSGSIVDIYPVDLEFPSVHHSNLNVDISWRNTDTKCKMQKMFLPAVIEDFEAIIYLDTATIVMRPIEELWVEFFRMREPEMLSMVLDVEPSETAVLKKVDELDTKTLSNGPGVLLMNLTKMRNFEWEEKLMHTLHQHHIHLGNANPQNILDTMVQIARKEMRLLSCQWNFRPFYCKKAKGGCDSASLKGFALVNGNSGLFHQGNGIFSHIYSIFKNFDPHQMDIFENFLKPMKKTLKTGDFALEHCSIVFSALATYMDDSITRLYGAAESFAMKGYYSQQHEDI